MSSTYGLNVIVTLNGEGEEIRREVVVSDERESGKGNERQISVKRYEELQGIPPIGKLPIVTETAQ